MAGFKGFGGGLGGGLGKGITRSLSKMAATALPLHDISPLRRNPVRGEEQRTFQGRPGVFRRGLKQVDIGEPAEEQRAAKDVAGSVWERIVVKELRRRRVAFQYQTAADGGLLSISGYNVDFLITDRPPGIALDVFSTYHDWGFLPAARLDLAKVAAIESNGYQYSVMLAEMDIAIVEVFEQRMDEILGRIASFGQPSFLQQ